MNEYIFNMTNDGVFFGKSECIPLSNTNLPVGGFAFLHDVYWKISITVQAEVKAEVRVLSYKPSDKYIINQQEFPPYIKYLFFAPFYFNELQYQVAVLITGTMRRLCFDHPRGPKNLINKTGILSDQSSYTKEKMRERELILRKEEKPELSLTFQITTEFKCKFAEARIEDGCITFNFTVDRNDFRVKIENKHLRKEYEIIKEYLVKKFGKKSFQVTITYEQPVFKVLKVESKDIEAIDESYIDHIRISQIRSLVKIEATKNDAKILPLNEVFAKSEIGNTNLFDLDVDDIILVLTDNYAYRNSEELKYLANIHHANKEKVFISLNPYFGFLFFYETDTHYFYIWELLNNYATYIWRFSKNAFDQLASYQQTEQEINTVHDDGRNLYKKSFREGNHSFNFEAIDHDEIEVNPEISFAIWKNSFERILSTTV